VYYPIALLKCLGKLLEKVVAKWIIHNVMSLNLIPTTQFGAHPFSSTIDASLCLTNNIETTHSFGSVCGTLLFNIQGFFDNVNHTHLTSLVHALG
jgi:Reverse transcriptase (RNA-dependent DNA polymerase)